VIKAHKKFAVPTMRRSSRIFPVDVNPGKAVALRAFLLLCRNVTQYFIDLFWQRGDRSAALSDLKTVHRGRDRFAITTRLAQALAKQAKEAVRAVTDGRRPKKRRPTVTLYSHFVQVSKFDGSFDYALCLIGSGAPRMTIPFKSTTHLNRLLADGWQISKSVRLGIIGNRLFVDLLLEKPRPAKRVDGAVVGMDSNYKAGFVFSDGQVVGADAYNKIAAFAKRQKHTHAEIKSLVGQAVKQIDWSNIKLLCVEDLKRVKFNTRGKFPRSLNRRLSHWLYAYAMDLLNRHCEEQGVRLERKDPWKTSQYCRFCGKWDRRNRRGDRFKCVHCSQPDHADHNASKNLELLGLAGVYSLRSLPSPG